MKYSFFYIGLLVLYSCNSGYDKKINKKSTFINQDTIIKFGKTNKFTEIEYKNKYLCINLYNKKWGSYYEFDKKINLTKKLSINYFGEKEAYLFDEYGSLYLQKRYLDNKIRGKGYCLQDIIAYDNGMVDKSNSNFINVKILDTIKDQILLEIEYISGYKFINGKIFVGKQVEDISETKLMNSMDMLNRKIAFWISKNKVIYNGYIEFSALINWDIDSEINGFQINKTKSIKNDNEFSQFFVVRRLLKSTN